MLQSREEKFLHLLRYLNELHQQSFKTFLLFFLSLRIKNSRWSFLKEIGEESCWLKSNSHDSDVEEEICAFRHIVSDSSEFWGSLIDKASSFKLGIEEKQRFCFEKRSVLNFNGIEARKMLKNLKIIEIAKGKVEGSNPFLDFCFDVFSKKHIRSFFWSSSFQVKVA